jgi:hypothetical protein
VIPPVTTAVLMLAAMREGIVTIMVSLLLLFCLKKMLLLFCLKKMNCPLYLFGSPMSAAAACTCLICTGGGWLF